MGIYLRRLKEHVPFVICAVVICALIACAVGPSSPTPPLQNVRPDPIFTGKYEFKYVRTLPPTGNDLYTIVVEVRNRGTAPAKSVQVIGYSKGPGIKGYLEPLENNGYYSIDAGQTVQARFQWIFEKQFSGEYEFTFTVDTSNNRLVFKRTF